MSGVDENCDIQEKIITNINASIIAVGNIDQTELNSLYAISQALQDAYNILLDDINKAPTKEDVNNLTERVNYFVYTGLPTDKNKSALQQAQAERKIELVLNLPQGTMAERTVKLRILQNIADNYPIVASAEKAAWNNGTNEADIKRTIASLQKAFDIDQNEVAYSKLLNDIRIASSLTEINRLNEKIKSFDYDSLSTDKTKNVLEDEWEKRKMQLEKENNLNQKVAAQRAYDNLLAEINKATNSNIDYTQRITNLDWKRLDGERTKPRLEKVQKDRYEWLIAEVKRRAEEEAKVAREWLLRKLKNYYVGELLLSEKEVKKAYEKESKDYENIILQLTTAEDLKTGTSERIFKLVVSVIAADEILEKIDRAKKFGVNPDDTILTKLKVIEKGLKEFLLSKEDKKHVLYLKDVGVEKNQARLQLIQEKLVYYQQNPQLLAQIQQR